MKILLILFIALMVLLTYSLCVASSTADRADGKRGRVMAWRRVTK